MLRDAQFAIDTGDTGFAPGLHKLLQRAVGIGRRRAELKHSTLAQYRADLDRRRDRLLATAPTTEAGRKLAQAIRKCRGDLFVFVTRRDVPATNNQCERALRPSVIFRKLTGGFRSKWGAHTYAHRFRHRHRQAARPIRPPARPRRPAHPYAALIRSA